MSYAFKFVKSTDGKTVEEGYPDVQSAHAAMGYYAAKHDLNFRCAEGRWNKESRSIAWKGDNEIFGVCAYVSIDMSGGHTGRVRGPEE